MKLTSFLLPTSIALLGYAAIAAPPVHTGGGKVAPKGKPEPSQDIIFDRDVAPILSQHCYKCHGPDATKAAAGLRLDSLDFATKKLGDGQAIVPGDPKSSIILTRVSDPDPEERMPPKGGPSALTKEQIETLRAWIASGAKYEKHWSYVPPVMPPLPVVKNLAWCKNPIDRFVLAKLEGAGMKPEPEADKATLALRASQTLIGLAPSPAELKAFLADTQPNAYERYVDRLLAKPQYGEHEARYWLDAVRYGDTHGLQLDNERAIYPYRDWVISAFNRDLPFNKFVEWQLAGDLLPKPTNEQLVATGYVRSNLTSNEGGAIAEEFLARNTFDRVDTTATVMLGLTAGCAKCHDHKYDPIKQSDYYGLYAYFDSTKDEPLDGNIALPPPYVRAETAEQEASLNAKSRLLEQARAKVVPEKALAWFSAHQEPIPTNHDWRISPVYTEASFDLAFDKAEAPEPGQPGVTWKPFKFELGKDYAGIIGKDNSSVYVRGTITLDKPRKLTLYAGSDDGIKIWLNGKLIHSHKISRGLADGSDKVVAEFQAGDNELIAKVINGGEPDGLRLTFGEANAMEVNSAIAGFQKMPTDAKAVDTLRDAFLQYGPETDQAKSYRQLLKARADEEAALPMTLIAQEMEKPRPTFILKRGLYDQKGDPVQRHIPKFLGSLSPRQQNNRLGLAQWMIDPKNPLVSRVFVNRVWQQHFGVGIVKTVDDFGSQGEWPLNKPLLDYLAVEFEMDGWSVKRLNRMIVTSAAFRQSSHISPEKLSKDPENRLASRGPRFRLDAEVIRDKALEDGGLLVEKIGGHGIKPYQPDGLWESVTDPASGTHIYKQDKGSDIYRRSLYIFWKRTSPPPVLVTFDAPLRDTCIVRRSTTNTPLQALVVLNEPGFLESSRTMAARIMAKATSDKSRLNEAFTIALDRKPKPDESKLLLKAVNRYRKLYTNNEAAAKKLLMVGDSAQNTNLNPADQAAWMIVCSSLMNTDEFLTQH